MKKHLTTLYLFAATMLVAATLTGCGEEVVIDDNKETKGLTEFSTGSDDDGTRTSIDRKANFYWEIGDKIWVDGGIGYKASSQSDITAAKQPQAKFVVDSTYTADRIKVIYTGYAAGDTAKTYYNKVTIADQQTQKDWNDGSHLGASGDCASGYAHKKPGGYQFTLDHKAAYLVLYPYLHSSLSGYTLEKIEIYSDLSASSIAGEFPFTFENGLADQANTGTGKQQITLNCGTGSSFQLSTDFPADITSTTTTYRHCFVVIAPGTHQLTIKYITKNASNETVEFVKDINANKYVANGVYPYIHELNNPIVNYGFVFNEDTRYRWGATSTTDPVAVVNDMNVTTGFWSTIPSAGFPNSATNYLGNGVYYDNATEWVMNRTAGGQVTLRGGWWLKKWEHLGDLGTWHVDCTPGRPAATEIHKYFFLPALMQLDGLQTQYWLRRKYSATEDVVTYWVAKVMFAPASAAIAWQNVTPGTYGDAKNQYNIAGTRPDGTPWWQ